MDLPNSLFWFMIGGLIFLLIDHTIVRIKASRKTDYQAVVWRNPPRRMITPPLDPVEEPPEDDPGYTLS